MTDEHLLQIRKLFPEHTVVLDGDGLLVIHSYGEDIELTYDNLAAISIIVGSSKIDIISLLEHGYYGDVGNELSLRIR